MLIPNVGVTLATSCTDTRSYRRVYNRGTTAREAKVCSLAAHPVFKRILECIAREKRIRSAIVPVSFPPSGWIGFVSNEAVLRRIIAVLIYRGERNNRKKLHLIRHANLSLAIELPWESVQQARIERASVDGVSEARQIDSSGSI